MIHIGSTYRYFILMLSATCILISGCAGKDVAADGRGRGNKAGFEKQPAMHGPQDLEPARELMRKGLYARGAVWLEPIVVDAPEPESLLLYGICLRETDRPEAALEVFSTIIDMAPQHAGAYNEIGITCARLNEQKLSLESFRQAVLFAPDRADYRNNLGFSLLLKGELLEAEAMFRSALAISPRYEPANFNLALTLGLMHRDEEAMTFLQGYFSPALAYHHMGTIHLVRGEEKEAKAMFRIATRLDPTVKFAANEVDALRSLKILAP
jgi:tetratricopeptide (TPR) repeat protein